MSFKRVCVFEVLFLESFGCYNMFVVCWYLSILNVFSSSLLISLSCWFVFVSVSLP